MTWYRRLDRWIDDILWQPELERVHAPRRWLLIALRIASVLIDDMRSDRITLRAMGLVYITLVSLVPLLALAFALLKAFGVANAMRPTLERFLSPLGSGSHEIVERIVGFVQNVQVGVLGAVGVVVLLYSVVSLVQQVEAGCNEIWHVTQARSIGRRVSEYLSILIAGPLVILAAASLTAAVGDNGTVSYLSSIEGLGSLLYLLGLILPYFLYAAGFTLLFKFLPNTHVQLAPAFGGGLFAGVLWQTAGLAFAVFARNAGNVNAIYSSFAIVILLLIWLYVAWLIVLTGCRVAFLLQYPERLTRGAYPPRLGGAETERLALLVAALVADRFIRGCSPWTIVELARALRVAPDHVRLVADQLISGHILMQAGEPGAPLVPRRDIAEVDVAQVIDRVRTGSPAARARPRDPDLGAAVDPLLADGEQARTAAYAQRSLRDLALSVHRPAGEDSPGV